MVCYACIHKVVTMCNTPIPDLQKLLRELRHEELDRVATLRTLHYELFKGRKNRHTRKAHKKAANALWALYEAAFTAYEEAVK